MLYLFDLDRTLITCYMDSLNRNYHEWSLLPGRVATLARLYLCGHALGIVTNQAGVAFGHVTERDWERKIAEVCVPLRIDRAAVYVCFADVRSPDPRYNSHVAAMRRKPSRAMIQEAVCDYPEQAALGVLYVGDRDVDQQTAHNAGVPFQWTHIFFKD